MLVASHATETQGEADGACWTQVSVRLRGQGTMKAGCAKKPGKKKKHVQWAMATFQQRELDKLSAPFYGGSQGSVTFCREGRSMRDKQTSICGLQKEEGTHEAPINCAKKNNKSVGVSAHADAHPHAKELAAFTNALHALVDFSRDVNAGDCAKIEEKKRKFRRLALDWRKAVESSAVCTAPSGKERSSDAAKVCAKAYFAAANNPACFKFGHGAADAMACHIRRIVSCSASDSTPEIAQKGAAQWCLNACRLEAFYVLHGDQDVEKRSDLQQFVAPLWDVLWGECSLSLMAGARHCY